MKSLLVSLRGARNSKELFGLFADRNRKCFAVVPKYDPRNCFKHVEKMKETLERLEFIESCSSGMRISNPFPVRRIKASVGIC